MNKQDSVSKSRAVEVARAHIDAWSHHEYDKARRILAPDVHVTATTTQPMMAGTDLSGIDKYMDGLVKFADAVIPGSANITQTFGDDRNALVVVTVRATFAPGTPEVTLPAARLYLLDDRGKIKAEQIIFFALSA